MDHLTGARKQLEDLAKTKLPILTRRRWPWSQKGQNEETVQTDPTSPSTTSPDVGLRGLCQNCSKIDLESMLARETNEQNAGLLLSFTTPNCPFCAIVSDSIRTRWGNDWNTQKLCGAVDKPPTLFIQSRSPLTVRSNGPVEHPHARLLLAIDIIPAELERHSTSVNKEVTKIKDRHIIAEIESLPDPSAPANPNEKTYLARREVSPQADIALVKQWLAECKTHKHSKTAHTGIDSDFLFREPGFRLIDVENECLVQVTERCDYIALSYVWGAVPTVLWRYNSSSKKPILLTIKENVTRLGAPRSLTTSQVAEFEDARIPTTVQDAMEFTRRIGMKYLWVDTLCIVQNDSEDKGRIIGSMDDIYSTATATLVGAAGVDADAGLSGVRNRPSSTLVPTKVPRGSKTGDLNLSICLRSLSEEVRRSTWHTRGWTFQEQSLSRRCLYFTPNEIFFNCDQAQFREGYRVDTTNSHVELRMGPPWWTRNLRKDPDPTPYRYLGNPDSLGAQEYQSAVQDYMRRNLTVLDDILNAFEGVFNRFSGADRATRLGIRDTQGIPAHLLYLGLLWFPSDGTKRRPALKAPSEATLSHFSSWSWSSRLGPVDFVFGESEWVSRNISYALRNRLPIHVSIVSWHFSGSARQEWTHSSWKAAYSEERTTSSKVKGELSHTNKYLTERIGVDLEKLRGQPALEPPSDLLSGELGFLGAYLPKGEVTLALSEGKSAGTIKTLEHSGQFRFDDEPCEADQYILIVSADTIKKPADAQSTLPMDSQLLYITAATALVGLISLYLFRSLWSSPGLAADESERAKAYAARAASHEPAAYITELASALPSSVILPRDVAAFVPAMKGWFSSQNRDIIPACIVRPRDVQELSTAVKHIQREHADRARQGNTTEGLFAVRAGGANPATGISGVENGVVLDLSLLSKVEPAEDGSSVTIGGGAYWLDVYKALEGKGIGVVGGRSSPVGVGGSCLQGGMSFWSPMYGFMCSNVISYQVVLADGSIVTASADENPDLWRALKGGGNNFGIVSQFQVRSFPIPDKIWTGSFVSPGFLGARSIKAFHQHVRNCVSGEPGAFDEHATAPILSMGYLTDVGISICFHYLAYTKPSPGGKWPEYWAKSPFRSLWGVQNVSKNETVHKAVVEMGVLSKTDNRNAYGTTTIKNDLETILAVRQICRDAIPSIKHVKNCMFIFVLQTVLPQWMSKGDPNMLGLEDCAEPLIIVSFAVNWNTRKDDEVVTGTVRRCLERIEEVAAANNASHPFRFSNYSSEWQQPLKGCGPENMRFMRGVSEKYDPEGLFQTGCFGGFKLDKDEKMKI
ncbi:uncharacterized protein DNG_09899 [Cephalotrichum gorgonifer]|uniref:FAD-binding PCMH-type domain-containing protein n=1 Tax=Cephalotrichum gorgonifer TaxID=2041049 RepID=A0AAE8N6K5_9PEZI|nr:uncharacterized protein DNG_09899 [Cephalotrichum gorgonifer]